MDKNLNIFFASNDAYAQHLAVTITSVIANANDDERLNFYILDSGISKQNQLKIKALAEIRPFEIEFVNVEYFDNLPELLHLSKDTYSRAKVPTLFPNLQKALYLDCDMVVRSSLVELWNVDISQYLVAASPDIMNYSARQHQGVADYITQYTGSIDNYYFNAGMLLMNLEKLREFDFENKFISYANEIKEQLRYGDQDILNGLLAGKVKYVDQSWNYDQRFEMHLGINPRIIHYTTERKPWVYEDGIFYSEYAKYLELSCWNL